MLLRSRVANVRSLRDEQELSFVAREDIDGDLTAAHDVPLSDGRHLPVHTVLGVFGPNASGKSNVITALKNMRQAVLRSYADWTSYDGIPRDEFALDPKAAKETTLYETDFLLGGEPDGDHEHTGQVRRTYGFELGQRRVEAEWLYTYPKGHHPPRRASAHPRRQRRTRATHPGLRLVQGQPLGRHPRDRTRPTRGLHGATDAGQPGFPAPGRGTAEGGRPRHRRRRGRAAVEERPHHQPRPHRQR